MNTFLTTHTVEQAVENLNAVKAELIKNLPGGESNIKAMFIKSTNQVAIPIYLNNSAVLKDIKLENNMNPKKIKKAKKLAVKRLKHQKAVETKKKNRLIQANQSSAERQLLENKDGIIAQKVELIKITNSEKLAKNLHKNKNLIKKSIFIK